ncbi:hypothetical secreted protein [Pseudomonas knackmussii B13]|uniref:Hypothetical secreted protein n=1 Tax=Pseudomonas knackmussii (strain DSM 6978 / CCUG 54928 / LMG 23759 / B13) TaxID=1301098 RepID=A0A024HEU0_PSEKB|nr:hypothetical secreted protein [Pseudomonas knackmussii B13]
MRLRKRRCCSSSLIENPVLDQLDARTRQHALELRHAAEELLVLLVAAKAHHPLDPGAVVPAAVEQHDLPRRRQVRDVALEVPLGLFAVVRRGQRGDPAHARVEALGDALDHTPLARRVAAFEKNHHLVPALHHPALQLHQLALQAEQLAEVAAPGVLFLIVVGNVLIEQRVEAAHVFQQLQLQLFVALVEQFAVDAVHQAFIDQGHGGTSQVGNFLLSA